MLLEKDRIIERNMLEDYEKPMESKFTKSP